MTRDNESFGAEFWPLTDAQCENCRDSTLQLLPSLGRSAPAVYQQLGVVLSLLDRMASCFWGCTGSLHVVEPLAARVVSHGIAARRLLLEGHYDESLVLARSIGEIANLVVLFAASPKHYQEWLSLSGTSAQWNAFKPVRVRDALSALAPTTGWIERTRYRTLSSVVAHPNTETRPQAFGPEGPHSGGRFQQAGVMICLNELAAPIALSATPFAHLIAVSEANRVALVRAAVQLLECIGGIDLSVLEQQQ